MLKTNTREAIVQLKNFKEDITFAIAEEDLVINVTSQDIKRIDLIAATIKGLEADYERLYDKIAHVIRQRANDVGHDNIENDPVAQILISLIQSEK